MVFKDTNMNIEIGSMKAPSITKYCAAIPSGLFSDDNNRDRGSSVKKMGLKMKNKFLDDKIPRNLCHCTH